MNESIKNSKEKRSQVQKIIDALKKLEDNPKEGESKAPVKAEVK